MDTCKELPQIIKSAFSENKTFTNMYELNLNVIREHLNLCPICSMGVKETIYEAPFFVKHALLLYINKEEQNE